LIVIGVPFVVSEFFSSSTRLNKSARYQSTEGEEGSESSHKKRFKASIQFNKDVPVMRIAHDVRLDPGVEEVRAIQTSQKEPLGDFWAFFAIVRVRHLSAKGSRHIFALKYDAEKPLHPGWGIAFHRMGNDIFPEVYWGTPTKKGQWYRFMPVSVQFGEWWAVGLSFEENRYLVLHTQPLYADMGPTPKLAESQPGKMVASQTSFRAFRGAYDVGGGGAACSSADLMLGASPGSNFKGGFGFFGAARVKGESSEGWFIKAVDMINHANRTGDVVSHGEEIGDLSADSAFKSDKLEFVLGSFDGKHEVITRTTLP
jgi:hypothetical protein